MTIRSEILLVVSLLASSAVAQKVDIHILPAPGQAHEFTIQSRSKITSQRKILIDGEEMEGRFGGGGGPTTTFQKIVLEQGPDRANWRVYRTAEATVTRPGRDGEDHTSEIRSALAGKKLFLRSDDGGTVILQGDAKGKPVDAELSRGVPQRVSLNGLTPEEPVALEQEFDLSKSLVKTIATLVHPVRPAAEEGAREGRGRRGGGERQGRGQGRGGRGFGRRGRRGVNDAALAALKNQHLTCKALGRVISVETRDGRQLATVAITAKLSGKGTPAELGMSRGFGRGGRRGGGRAGGGRASGGRGGQASGEASLTLELKGTLVVDCDAHQVQSLKLEGKLDSKSKTTREMRDRELEITSSSTGTATLEVACRQIEG